MRSVRGMSIKHGFSPTYPITHTRFSLGKRRYNWMLLNTGNFRWPNAIEFVQIKYTYYFSSIRKFKTNLSWRSYWIVHDSLLKCLEGTPTCLIWLNWSHGKMIWHCDWIVTPRYGPSRTWYRTVDGLKLHLSYTICPATCHYETLPEITESRQQVEPLSVCRCRIYPLPVPESRRPHNRNIIRIARNSNGITIA